MLGHLSIYYAPIKPWVRAMWDIKNYVRYRDDIFIVSGKNRQKVLVEFRLGWEEAARQAGSSFIIDKWEASPSMVQMVDLDVMLVPGYNRLQYRNHWKPSSLGIPLSWRSGHKFSVHMSWPVAEIHRLAMNSCTHASFLAAKLVTGLEIPGPIH
eukprot:gnl/TRDRNA2_/TRDRNA2_193809_c0_seq1.p1 gnl/TRDRNA2_/TRDRNA2_193809_c0~~gnl/TRDRNA2_/TRDRNA2_193809_c0_seq1.p1  ORF type:complete len:154 (-),score=18.30 gnl/TRDRNA2_/TRDRNA2_193809_c0_seq1:76-537(-)